MENQVDAIESELNRVRGERIKAVRQAIGLSRAKLAALGDFGEGTLNGWERGRFTGLSKDGAIKLSKVFLKKGIACTPEWLLFGVGDDPLCGYSMMKGLTDDQEGSSSTIDHLENAYKKSWKRHLIENSKNFVYEKMPDNSLAPFLKKYDPIVGIQIKNNDYHTVVGELCMLETISNGVMVGKFEYDSSNKRLTLKSENVSSSPYTCGEEEVVYLAELISFVRAPK